MRVNIENCAAHGSNSSKAWLLDELVGNLKELRDRTNAGDIAALGEFFSIFRFNDSDSLNTQKAEENAKRIVACINACAGIPTDALEIGRMSPDAFLAEESRADKAEQQRDQLLAALESLIDMDVAYNRGPKVVDAVEAAKKIIASVKGEA